MALLWTPPPDLGQSCPTFSLPATDETTKTHRDLIHPGSPGVLVFMCNHCPYVLAIEDRLIELGHDLSARGIPMLAISSNDASRYPADSFEAMKRRAQEKNYSFSYLYDESQSVARDFGAVCTPDFFVFDNHGQLAYRGRLDDSWKDPHQVTKRELFEAVLLLQKGSPLTAPQTPSMGCSLKWKEPRI